MDTKTKTLFVSVERSKTNVSTGRLTNVIYVDAECPVVHSFRTIGIYQVDKIHSKAEAIAVCMEYLIMNKPGHMTVTTVFDLEPNNG